MNQQPRNGAGPAFSSAAEESCSTCGGDRRIGNSFGLTTTCPSCHGSGRRAEDAGFHDVTKTKPSHHGTPGSGSRTTAKGGAVAKPQWPVSFSGGALADQVKASGKLAADVKAKLIREIIDHEASHAVCTQTFIKKVRKQVGPPPA
jgi:hypothetical protein